MSPIRKTLTYLNSVINDVRIFLDNNISLTAWLIAIPYAVAGIISGIGVVGYSKVFLYAESLSFRIYELNHYLFLVASPLFFYIGWLFVRYTSKAATGSGIPQIMAALKTLDDTAPRSIRHLLSFKVIVTKVLSSCMAIIGGAGIGREGPSLQISASIYVIVHRFKPKSWPSVNRQKMVLAGAAAGLAAAFNTPLGGIVFAIEELSKSSIHSFRSSLLFSVILAGLTTQTLAGPYLFLGYPNIGKISLKYYLIIILVATVTGLAGAFKSRLILKLNAFKRTFSSEWQHHAFVIACGLALAVLILLIGIDAIGSGKMQMQTLLFTDSKDMDWTMFPARFLSSIISFSSGVAGGVFAPSLATGASVGALFSHFVNFDMDNKIIILCGMIGFLTGVTRSPFTSAVLVLEMTDRHSAIFPMMLAAIVANLTAALVMKHSLYDHLMQNYMYTPEKTETI